MSDLEFFKVFYFEYVEFRLLKFKLLAAICPSLISKEMRGNFSKAIEDGPKLLSEDQLADYNNEIQKNIDNIKLKAALSEEKSKQVVKKIKDGIIGTIMHGPSKELYNVINDETIQGPGFYQNIRINAAINNISFDFEPHGVFVLKNGSVDIITYHVFAPLYIDGVSDVGTICSFRFPIDHMKNDHNSVACIKMSLAAYILEKAGYRIGNLIFYVGDKAVLLPYKKWEIGLMIKYFRYINKGD